jgi:ribose transport system ATP-binding protein
MDHARDGHALVLANVSKTFQGQPALVDVDLEVRPGEIHCLLGHNGSGKSTLIKILAGYHSPDHGAQAWVDGASLELGSSRAAAKAGIHFLHQDLGLVQELNAVDNLALGGRYAGGGWLSTRREARAATAALREYGVDLDATAPLSEASAAQKSMLAIVRALTRSASALQVLVLDEPTAAMPDRQVRQLFTLLRELRSRAIAVVYVTHRLGEVFEIGDRVTVLRNGARVATIDVPDISPDALVEMIVGRPLEQFYPDVPEPRSEVLLRARGIANDTLLGVDLDVHAGEIVGVTGLTGSGYDELLGLVFGARRRAAGGSVTVQGRVTPGSPRASIAAGLAYAPADRKSLGTISQWTVRENLTLPRLDPKRLTRWLSRRQETRSAAEWVRRLDVVPRDPERELGKLSGGNQQKVVLARWLRIAPQVLMLDEPTSGVDTGTKQSIYRALTTMAVAGTAVVIASSDAEELCAVCDRVIVMRAGAVAAELHRDELDVDRLVSETIRMQRPTQDGSLAEPAPRTDTAGSTRVLDRQP